MELFLLSNLALSCIAVLYNKYSRSSVTGKLAVSIFALLCWIIPFTLLRKILPQDVAVNVTWLTAQFSETTLQSTQAFSFVDETSNAFNFSMSLEQIFISLTSIGLLIFCSRLIKQLRWSSQVKNHSKTAYICLHKDLPVYSSPLVKNAILLGYSKPNILINNNLTGSEYLDIILEHEHNHYRHRDNYWLVLLVFTKSIYWWNPLLRILVSDIEEYIEARCDLKSSQSFTEGIYEEKLTDLVLASPLLNNLPVSNTGFASAVISKNSNVRRLKILKEKQKMTLFSKLSISLLLLGGLVFVTIPLSTIHAEAKKVSTNATEDHAFSLNFESIPIAALTKMMSEFWGVHTYVTPELAGESNRVNTFMLSIPSSIAMQVFTKATNTQWTREGDRMYVNILPDGRGINQATELAEGGNLKLTMTYLSAEGKQEQLDWPYELTNKRWSDFYYGQYLLVAKTDLLDERQAEISIEIFEMKGFAYESVDSISMKTKLGKMAAIKIDDMPELSITPHKL